MSDTPRSEAIPGSTTKDATRRSVPILARMLASDLFVLVLTVGIALMALPFTNGFLSPGNLTNIASNYWPLLLIVVGQAFVLITAGIDLSQTATLALSNVVGAILITTAADPNLFSKSPFWGILFDEGGSFLGSGTMAVIFAWLVMLSLGGLVGLLNGFAISRMRMPPFMVTLTTMLFVTAFAVWTTKSENVRNLPPLHLSLADGWVAAGVGVTGAIIAHLILSRSVLGEWFYSIGINEAAARVSGVPTRAVITSAYVLSGMFTAAAAALYSARLGAGRPTLGSTLLLDVIGAVVIGGVSLMGGRGRITGAALGVLFFVVLTNVLNLMGLAFYTIMWVKGLVILTVVGIDAIRLRWEGVRT